MYFTYIIECEDGTLYTGITNDVNKRMSEHFNRTPKCAKYTRTHKAKSLVALWQSENRKTASKLEWHIKHISKEQKLKIIKSPQDLTPVFKSETNDEYMPVKNFEELLNL